MTDDPFNSGYYGETELRRFGFGAVGENVRIAKDCTIVGRENITFGSHVRIDPYTVITAAGPVKFGSYVHIGGYCYLSGAAGLTLEDFSGLSQGVRLYTATDDYSGKAMTNPMVPEEFTNVRKGPIHLGRHVIIGSGSIVLPGCAIGEGSSVGALSLVTKSLEPWGMYFGSPAERIKARSKRLLELEAQFLAR